MCSSDLLADLIDQLRRDQDGAPAAVLEPTTAYEPAGANGTNVPAATLRTTSGFGDRGYWRRVAELGMQAAGALEDARRELGEMRAAPWLALLPDEV